MGVCGPEGREAKETIYKRAIHMIRNLIITVAAALSFTAGAQTNAPTFWSWAEKPVMGWNSWDCFATTVTEAQTKAQADVMAAKLKPFGWEYVTVDIQWFEPNATGFNYRKGAPLVMDEFSRLLPATNRFPSAANGAGFKPLADYIHGQGLKFGIHLLRGIPRQAVRENLAIKGTTARAADIADTNSICPWNGDMYGVDMSKPGAQEYYNSLFELVAAWGVDLVKVDDLSRPYHKPEIEAIRKAIDRTGRPMVFSTSPGETPVAEGRHVADHANQWRISDDFWDNWKALKEQFARCHNWEPFIGPGHFPDADMLPLGTLDLGKRKTHFSPDEQVTLMTLWSIFRSPLIMGGDLTKLDDATLALLTNPEVIAVNQNSTHNRQLFNRDGLVAWVADVPGSTDRYLALFNAHDNDTVDEQRAAFRSGVVSRSTPGHSVEVSVNVSGAKKLWLVVDDAGDGLSADHADWVEPRLVGPQGEQRLTDQRWVRATAGWGKPSTTQAASGAPMKVGGQPVAYGIGTHAASIIEYNLPEDCTRFLATGALDDGGLNQNQGATVRFMVFTNEPFVAATKTPVAVSLAELGFAGPAEIRDLWRRKTIGRLDGEFAPAIPAHGAELYRVSGERVQVPARAYLFTHFINNGEDGLHLAWSRDGLKWESLNNERSYLKPLVGESKLMRDPCVTQGPDGTFHMVWTTSWGGNTIGYASTKDFIHWSEELAIPVMAQEPTVKNCWAPEIVWDAGRQDFLIYWASTIPGRFPATDSTAEGGNNHRIYSTTTKDFKTFTPTRLFYDPGFNVIDATMIQVGNEWKMIVKDETPQPVAKKHLRITQADNPEGPFPLPAPTFTRNWIEGPTALHAGDYYYVYYDCYTDHRYGAVRTRDWQNWEDVTSRLTTPTKISHGTAIPVDGKIIEQLLESGAK
jgi:alpha-galactosidase